MSNLMKAAAFLDKETICEIMLKESPPGGADNCMMGILNIYNIVYANYLLANGTRFKRPERQKVCTAIQQRSQEILNFFEYAYPIRKSQRDFGFLQWASWMAESDETTIEDEFESSEDILIKAGFRKIDLELWLACQKFDLFQVKMLLASGANPNVYIPMCVYDEDLPLTEDYTLKFETHSVLEHISCISADFIDCDNGYQYWDCGVNGGDMEIGGSYLPSLVKSAAFQIFYNTVMPYCEK